MHELLDFDLFDDLNLDLLHHLNFNFLLNLNLDLFHHLHGNLNGYLFLYLNLFDDLNLLHHLHGNFFLYLNDLLYDLWLTCAGDCRQRDN